MTKRGGILAAVVFLAGCMSPTGARVPVQQINAAGYEVAADASADSMLVDLQTLDPSIRVEMRYATSANFTGSPLPGYLANRAYLRREAALALSKVQASLRRDGLGLLVYDSYRPVRATDAMVEWTKRTGREDLLRDGYIASRSRHNLGLAIDLTLADLATGTPLEMGTAFDTFSRDAHTANANGIAAVNRRRLKAAMELAGFRNYAQEWWHFSFAATPELRFDRVIR